LSTPYVGLFQFEPYHYQIKLLLDRSPMRLTLKSRQTGVSQISGLECLHDALYQPGYVGIIISKDLDAAKNLLSYIKTTYDLGCPKPENVKVIKDNTVEIRFSNGSRIKSIAATKNAGRSIAATHVYMDEAAFPQWASQIYRAVKPTVSTGGRVTILSTPNGRNNLFFELWDGEIGLSYSKHRIHWTDCPAYYTPEEIAAGIPPEKCAWYLNNRPDYTTESWAQEFDCDFVQSGNACFKDTDVEKVFLKELGYEEPIPGEFYVSFWDVGRSHDHTVGYTARIFYDPATKKVRKRIVARDRFTGVPFQIIANRIDARADKYEGLTFVENNSIGNPVIEMCKNSRVKVHNTGYKSKIDMISALILDVENGTYESPTDKQLRAELLMYQWDDEGLTQDCVMALAGVSLYSQQTRRCLK
jgi:hypothetical protein